MVAEKKTNAVVNVHPQIWLSKIFKWKVKKYIKTGNTHILNFQYKGFQILFLFDQTVPKVYCELRKAV